MVCTDLEPPDDEDLTERTVDRYRSILVEIDTAFQGRVLTMEQGLSILLFDTAELAVGAAVGAAQAFEDSRTSATPIRARLAVHVEPTMRQSVLGAPVTTITCRAVCRAGHVGQIVVSEPAHRLLASALAEGMSLEPLGTHRLSDLGQPRPIYQLAHSSLPDDFPPPRTLEVQPQNLPLRSTDSSAVARKSVRCATNSPAADCARSWARRGWGSPPGAQAAAQMSSSFPDGTWHVDVLRLGPQDELETLIASTIGLADSGSGTYVGRSPSDTRSTADRLFDYLQINTR